MQRWHSFLDNLKIPLEILFFAFFLLGIGNLLTNNAFSMFYTIRNEYVLLFGEAFIRIASFLIVYFPIFFLLRLVALRINGFNSIITGLIGYVVFLVFSIYFSPTTLGSTAYSSILGINVSTSTLAGLANKVNYPLQTGLIGAAMMVFTTRLANRQTRNKSRYGFLSFINAPMWGILLNTIYAIIVAFVLSMVWPTVYVLLQSVFKFISADITNPVNMFLYGIMERVMSILSIGSIIKTPFWFTEVGGTWINMVGESVAGDVSIWTSVLGINQIPTAAGRFITPYYVLNIFAVPAMIGAFYSLTSDKMERRRTRPFFIIATLTSIFTGTLLPLEILLVLLCPILFFFHLFYTGFLYGLFESMHIALGMKYAGTSTITACPGTLLEFLSYIRNSELSRTILVILLVGAVSALVYFLFTRLYFKHMGIDLFNSGSLKEIVKGTIQAVGGEGNIKMLNSSISELTVTVFDSNLVNTNELKQLGATRISESRAGFIIGYGSGSTIIKDEINKYLRNSLKSVQ